MDKVDGMVTPSHAHVRDHEEWAAVFKTLGDPTRLSLLNAIHGAGNNQLGVTELANRTGTRVATTSAALRAMEKMGTVHSVREGRSIYYGIADERIHRLLHWAADQQ